MRFRRMLERAGTVDATEAAIIAGFRSGERHGHGIAGFSSPRLGMADRR